MKKMLGLTTFNQYMQYMFYYVVSKIIYSSTWYEDL
jgi:hypothetical protein